MNTAEKNAEWFNCALLPNEESKKRILSIVDELRPQLQSVTWLGNGGRLPHCTIYQAQFEGWQKLQQGIQGAVPLKNLEKQRSSSNKIEKYDVVGEKFLFADLEMRNLGILHEKFLGHCANHRIPMGGEELARLRKTRPADQVQNLQLVGMALAKSLYRPHFTLGISEEAMDEEEIARFIEAASTLGLPDIIFDRIALLNCNAQDGSATEILEEWPL